MKQKPDGKTVDLWAEEGNEDWCLEVRTLYQLRKSHQLTAEVKSYKLDILRASEVRWNQFGKLETPSGMTFLYSGRPKDEDEHTVKC